MNKDKEYHQMINVGKTFCFGRQGDGGFQEP